MGPANLLSIQRVSVQDFDEIPPETKLTICPLDCRAVRTPEAAAKHTILMYESFNLNAETREKFKFESALKCNVDLRITNLSKLLLNQISENKILDEAQEIINRQSTETEKSLPNKLELEIDNPRLKGSTQTNYHVSHVCKECESSKQHKTPPVLMEILYEG